MGWTSKDFEPQMLSEVILQSAQQVLGRASNLVQSQDPNVEATDIVEYDGRMRAAGLEKLNNTCYVSVVNFYLTQADLDKRTKAKGALIFYIEIESASKFYKTLGLRFAEDEDDASMMSACGEFGQLMAEEFKAELSTKGFPPLFSSKPRNYKNNVSEGVDYSPDQKTKHEVSFFFFKHKAIVVELTLATIPKK